MRKKMRSFLLLTCVLSMAALGGQSAFADDTTPAPAQGQVQGQPFQHRHRGHSFRRMANALGLSDLQKTQAKAFFKANRQADKPLFVSVITAKHQLKTLIASGTADPSAIQTQTTALATAEANLAVQKAQDTKLFIALLTSDQVTKYNEIQSERESRFQNFISHLTAAP